MKKNLLFILAFSLATFAFAQTPSLSAGKDQTIFAGQVAQLKGKAINVANHRWVSNGSGIFSKPRAIKTEYTPSAADIAKGKVKITIKSTSGPVVNDEMLLTIKPRTCPSLSMQSKDTICASTYGGEYYLDKAMINGTDYAALWTFSGGNIGDYISDDTNPTGAVFQYTASTGQAGQVVNFDLTLTDNSGVCSPVSSSIAVKFNDAARVDDFLINGYSANNGTVYLCDLSPISLDAALGGTASIAYIGGGGGGLLVHTSNTSAIYYPTIDDAAGGSLYFYVGTDDPNGPCGGASASGDAFIQMTVTNAGSDIDQCADINGGSVSISGSSQGYGELFHWSTNGSGYFDDESNPQTNYNYTASDVSMGYVELYAIGGGCSSSFIDTARLSISPSGSVSSGGGATVCGYNGGSVQLGASVVGGGNFSWSTSGSGWFDDQSNPNANYYYSQDDVNNTNITLLANLTGTCDGDHSDLFHLTLQEAASVYMPNSNVSACSNAPDVSAEAYSYGYAGPGTWSTWGTGYFDDIHSGYTIYHASLSDIEAGCVDLTYSVQGGGICGGASNSMSACFYDCGSSDLIANNNDKKKRPIIKNKISVTVYPNPSSNVLFLKTTGIINKNAFYISDITGKIIPCKWVSNNCLDISNLSSGVYFLRVKESTIKFIKQ